MAKEVAAMHYRLEALDAEKRCDELLEALKVARQQIATDRQSLIDCHIVPGEMVVTDELGTIGLAEYDAVLERIDAAMRGTEGCEVAG